ncbi:MAG: hypothetical protein ACK4N5_03610 [Myxococcales bacterium]
MLAIGSFVRVTRDAASEEPLVEGMVGRVVADVYGRADPGTQALVVMAGARKPCLVPLDAVEPISESDYGDASAPGRALWKQRKQLWKKRHGRLPPSSEAAGADEEDDGETDAPPGPPERTPAPRIELADLIRRAEAVQADEIAALASPALVTLLTEWSVGALDVLADLVPGFNDLPYGQAREIRTEHVERWLWDGVRLYLAMRTYHASYPPITPESSRERVRSLFERIDDGEPAERLSTFSLDVSAVKKGLAIMTSHWLREAEKGFARGLQEGERAHEELGRYILQLHIAGFQIAFCSDSANHALPSN